MKKEEGKYYHVYNRGNNKENIFFEHDNYSFFLDKFKIHLIPHIDVFSYCLMPNHFHFFLRVNDLQAFETGMKNFLISYAKAVNKKYNRVGSLFQGRYKVAEIDSDSYYTRIVTYIHQNPKKAGLVLNLEDYKFSSYKSFISPQRSSLLKRDEVLEWFGGIDEFIKSHNIVETYEVLKTS